MPVRSLTGSPARLIRRLTARRNLADLSDRELVALARDGDGSSFGQLYQRYVDPVYLYVRTRVGDDALAEDLTQDVFASAYGAMARFEWQGHVRAWLLRIAHNRVANHWRSTDRRPQLADLPEDDAPDALPTPDGGDPLDLAERAFDLDQLSRMVSRLSDLEREVIALRFGLELSVAEAASIMGRSEHSVRSLQYRAVQRFREQLAPMGGSG